MTLTKSHIIDAIAEQNEFARKKSSETAETILEIIKLKSNRKLKRQFDQSLKHIEKLSNTKI